MYLRELFNAVVICLLVVSALYLFTKPAGAANKSSHVPAAGHGNGSKSVPPRDEKLWKRALEIHRKAIVIDTHNDVTTPMTNDDYDLAGMPPVPYRTSLERMKQGGLTAEFFSLYVRPWYVAHGGAARRTLDMIDSVIARLSVIQTI